jgi:hypothetical protein
MKPFVYLAGPMTGLPQFNYPHFQSVAAILREEGFRVQSPAEMDDPATQAAALASADGAPGTGSANGETWGDFLARDVKLLADDGIEAVAVLDGWEKSRGARLETFVAHLCGLPIYSWASLAMHGDNPSKWRRVTLLELVRAWGGKSDISFHSPEGRNE